MNDVSQLDKFDRKAKEVGLEYLIIGGFAASFWGKPRFTADVDYVISIESFEIAKSMLESLGYSLLFRHPKDAFAHFGSKEKGGFRIDLMMVNSKTWSELLAESSTADFGRDQLLPIVSAKHLIAMKLHSAKQPDREEFFKDLLDISEIMKSQSISLEDLESEGILTKHGNEKTTEQLKTILGSSRE